ncbi:DUF1080 domain-containing protein [Georgenia phoenicis]|uniref:3-keto-disaccharide hydrolase n=1 Tax=unclassified Georgenia TaxID=2626815 RepID=UPI0039AF60A4
MPRSAALAAVAVLLVGCAGSPSTGPAEGGTCPPAAPEEGYRALFDGTQESLDAWRMAGPGRFELQEDCSMVTVGGMGLLWFPESFRDYRLWVEWRMSGDDNSGVFVGFPDPGDDPWTAVTEGYEIQIDPSDQPDRTTGAVYGVQGADLARRDEALAPPGEWNTYEIVADGSRLAVHLNGVLVNELVTDRPLAGHIGLQNHGPADKMAFRDVRIGPA